MTIDYGRAAIALQEARAAGRPAGPLPQGLVPMTEAEGVALQLAHARLVGAVPPAGFKIGATTRRMQEYLGLSGPAAGYMAAPGLHRSGATVRRDDYRGLGVECEIAVRLRHAIPPGPCDSDRAADAVGEVFAAMEIVENRYGPPPAGDLLTLGVPTLIADQVYHAGAVLGAPFPDWRTVDLAAVAGRILVDGRERGAGTGADLLGHPMNALAWLASSAVSAAFGGLQPGQVIMLGSVTPPVWLDGGARVEVIFEKLGRAEVEFS